MYWLICFFVVNKNYGIVSEIFGFVFCNGNLKFVLNFRVLSFLFEGVVVVELEIWKGYEGLKMGINFFLVLWSICDVVVKKRYDVCEMIMECGWKIMFYFIYIVFKDSEL